MTFDHSLRQLARSAQALFLALVLAIQTPLYAGGEGHSHDEAPASVVGPALPKFTAHSDLFEAVGVLNGTEMSLLIDRYETNEPVSGAAVELESDNLKVQLTFHAEHADYSMPAEVFKKPGTYPITLTIVAGEQTDLLTGELVVPDPAAGHANEAANLSKWLWPAGVAALLALALGLFWRLRRTPSRQTKALAANGR